VRFGLGRRDFMLTGLVAVPFLPIEQATKFILAFNQAAAVSLGLTLSPLVMGVRACVCAGMTMSERDASGARECALDKAFSCGWTGLWLTTTIARIFT
jgi:hypothetical protein